MHYNNYRAVCNGGRIVLNFHADNITKAMRVAKKWAAKYGYKLEWLESNYGFDGYDIELDDALLRQAIEEVYHEE